MPAGSSSPVIAGGRAFLTGFADGKLVTRAVNLADGAITWRHATTPEKLEADMKKLGTPAATTRATEGDRVVNQFGSHGLVTCVFDGKVRWDEY